VTFDPFKDVDWIMKPDEDKDKDWSNTPVEKRPCFCGLDKAELGGRHSYYCPKSQPDKTKIDYGKVTPRFI
jgi:hypothetical protein